MVIIKESKNGHSTSDFNATWAQGDQWTFSAQELYMSHNVHFLFCWHERQKKGNFQLPA